MQERIEISVCLGSSCFSRGNKEITRVIESFLEEHGIKDKVYFHGAHCFDKCNTGPVIKIGDNIFEGVNTTNIHYILNEQLIEIL